MKTWTLAHVISERVNPETKEKLLQFYYADGEEEVYEGVVHQLYMCSPHATNVASTSQGPSAQPRALKDHIGLPLSPRRPFDSHPSSTDEDTMNISDGSASEPSVDSEATMSDCNEAWQNLGRHKAQQ